MKQLFFYSESLIRYGEISSCPLEGSPVLTSTMAHEYLTWLTNYAELHLCVGLAASELEKDRTVPVRGQITAAEGDREGLEFPLEYNVCFTPECAKTKCASD